MEKYEMLCDELYRLEELLQGDLTDEEQEMYESELQEVINALIDLDKSWFFED